MNLVSVSDVTITFNSVPILKEAAFGIDQGDRIGLIGRNGSGKSTLLKLIAGKIEPDLGLVARNGSLTVSVLDQSPEFDPSTTLSDFFLGSDEPLARSLRNYERLHASPAGTGTMRELERLERMLQERGGFGAANRYVSLLSELGLADPEARMGSLSGGTAKKAALARCLAGSSDLILLDEPGNRLDTETVEWLEGKLKGASFAYVLVTHDRYFLDSSCASIMEIDGGRVYRYPGNYTKYLEAKRDRREQADRVEAKRRSVLRVELEWLERGPKARAGKSKSRKARIRGLQESASEPEEAMGEFSSADRRLGKKVLEVRDVRKSYGGVTALLPFSHKFLRGERIGVVGPNGSGKTTLLAVLAGTLAPDSGFREAGENTSFGYFEQDSSSLDPDSTVLSYIREKAELIPIGGGTELTAERFLERFLFPRETFDVPLSRLSGGEIRRLRLIRILAAAPNFLLLDEPTNDLDIGTIALLEDFLEGFSGCLVAVSHDRAFLDNTADRLFAFDRAGGITVFPGNYSAYRASAAVATAVPNAARSDAPEKPVKARPGKPGLTFNERREFAALMEEIETLEAEKAALEALFSDGNPVSGGYGEASRRYGEIRALIEEKTARWEELADKAEEGRPGRS